MSEVCSALVDDRDFFKQKGPTFFNLSHYGYFVLSSIPGGPNDQDFDAYYELANTAELDADFSVDKKKHDDSSCCQSYFPKSKKESQKDMGDDDEKEDAKLGLMTVLMDTDHDLQSAIASQLHSEESRRA
ncbi:hypothetical protein EHF_0617 [Ehrlichia japonica]|uniref:Uncharacterized protein n=2 Tax=Ehrlichia japonica TaxID=391036 RepID=X5H342_9RICK|nr:hypothetical protein [Ehrlichia japonica]AHX04485.1 hypothetical protein EHF_0617 [Ehrlichia japonica]